MRYVFALVILFSYISAALAERPISLEDAERLFIENNLELKAKKAELKRYDAEVIGAGLLPNPTVKYSRESEETYSISQSINIVRKRDLRMDVAQKRKNAQYLLYEQKLLNSISMMKHIYYRIILLKENINVIKGFHERFIDWESRTAKKVEAGDVSGVQLMRFHSEKKKIERLLSGMDLEIRSEQRNLAMLLNLPSENMSLKEGLYYKPVTFDAKELLNLAMEKRGDIKAASALVAAAKSSLNLSKKEVVMPVEVEVGYKRRTGGSNGFVFGVSIPIPLFNRNQDRIASALTDLKTEKIREELIKKQVLNEMALLLDRMASLNGRIVDASGQVKNAREITNIVSLLYEEGEASLIEMLDAVRSESELAVEHNHLIYEYMTTLFEMEKATGVNLINHGGAK